MRVLVVGAGGVGSAVAAVAARRDFVTAMAVTDLDPERAERAVGRLDERFSAAPLDASDVAAVNQAAKELGADAMVNACDPRFNEPIFEAAFAAGCTYLDMAMTLSKPHPERPHELTGVTLGEAQFAQAAQWQEKGQLALVGMGVEPGMSDVFARYARDHLFSEIDEIGVRDGANLEIEGYAFAPTFSIWTTIEECLNPPVIYEKSRGFYTTEPFSEPETFNFPEGIGPLECVNVEHEEVLLIPRVIDCNRVTFKYGLGDEFIEVLRTLHLLGLDSTKKVRVGKVEVAPRDVVAATLPDPATLGDRMHGKTCAGTWVKGRGPDGSEREVYLYHVADNDYCMKEYGAQAVVLQTALNPVIALELLSSETWEGAGVLGPEAFPADSFLELLADYGMPHGIDEAPERET
ncbi:MAG: saccharopine dehydrogenase NADP-binding domain-containing protein [Actinobacteria bacterium]|nr:saccharopine dehydrogenase NADP-binding domain-containing protein [Actinomycetota bacterium]